MSNVEMWSLIVGFFLPLAIAIPQQAKWSDRRRAIVGFLICAVAALITVWIAGELNGKDYVTSALIVLVAAIATYKGFWQKTGIAPAIEAATSPKV